VFRYLGRSYNDFGWGNDSGAAFASQHYDRKDRRICLIMRQEAHSRPRGTGARRLCF
jgi:hypothetical protein